jgi:hypothetical protein
MTEIYYPQKNPDIVLSSNILINTSIERFNSEELLYFLCKLEKYFRLKSLEHTNPFKLGYMFFCDSEELDENGLCKEFSYEKTNEKYTTSIQRLGTLFNRADTLGILTMEDEDFTISRRINRIIDQLDDAWQIIYRYNRTVQRVEFPTWAEATVKSDPTIFRTSIFDVEKLNTFQKALTTVLKELYESNIKRYRGYCCTQIKYNGFDTRAWNQKETIKEYVNRIAPKESRFELWQELTHNGTGIIDQVIKHLGNCCDMQFPEIVKDRHVWSFRNGIFIGKEWSGITETYKTAFYPYDSKEASTLDPSIVSCKYFDSDFEDYSHVKDWKKIPTPYFDKVLNSQEFPEEACNWMYVMGGRLTFCLNDIDKWQIIPFLKGIARSGKSTLITKVFQKFYEPTDVKKLSNNVEKRFGLSGIYDGLMFIAPEIKGDLNLEQAEFQSIVSGEELAIAVKFETAKNITWDVPGILGGNECPNWKDNSGSILRRLMTWHFKKQIRDEDTDPLLELKLEKEMPIILQKCVRGYLDYAQKYQDQDIWNVIPEYFKEVRKSVATVTNALEHYLQSDKVQFNSGGLKYMCPIDIFKERFFTYCMLNNLPKPRFNSDFYIGPFSSRGITIEKIDIEYNFRQYKNKDIILGVDMVAEEEY